VIEPGLAAPDRVAAPCFRRRAGTGIACLSAFVHGWDRLETIGALATTQVGRN